MLTLLSERLLCSEGACPGGAVCLTRSFSPALLSALRPPGLSGSCKCECATRLPSRARASGRSCVLPHAGARKGTGDCSLQPISVSFLSPPHLRTIKRSCKNQMKITRFGPIRSSCMAKYRRRAKKMPVFFPGLWNASCQRPRGRAFLSAS